MLMNEFSQFFSKNEFLIIMVSEDDGQEYQISEYFHEVTLETSILRENIAREAFCLAVIFS